MATIGELTNVPEPGAGVTSPWAQDVTNRVVHRFANKAALDAWTSAGVGAQAVTTDDGARYQRMAGGWSRQTQYTKTVTSIADNAHLMTIVVPADPAPRVLFASAKFSFGGNVVTAGQVFSQVFVNNVQQLEAWFGAGNPTTVEHCLTFDAYNIAADTVATVECRVLLSGVVGTFTMPYGDARYHRLSVCARPGIGA